MHDNIIRSSSAACFGKLILCAAIGALISLTTQAATPVDEVQIILKPKASMNEVDVTALTNVHGGREHKKIGAIKTRVLRVPRAQAAQLLAKLKLRGDVEYAEADEVAHGFATPNDPLFVQGTQWHLDTIQAPAAWNVSTGSANVIIAIVDSGINASNPEMAGKLLAGYDFVNNDSDPSDDNGHGTAVAGVVAPATNNGAGIAGIVWSNPVLPVKVLDATNTGNYSAIASGIIYAADNNARIINLSLGGTTASQVLQDAVDYAWSKGAIVVAAAGNNSSSTPNYPAACNHVVSVASTRFDDTHSATSNFGPTIDVCAPGEQIYTFFGTGYAYWTGTSFASPIASGVLALMASANPSLSNDTIVTLLLGNCDDLGTVGYDETFGYGRINALKAVSAAKNYVAPDFIAPTVAISSPASGSTISGTVNVGVSGTDNVAVTRLELWVDSVLKSTFLGSSATFALNTLAYVDGAHTIQAKAYDAAGNSATTSIPVTVHNAVPPDTTAPVTTITSPTNNSHVSGKSVKVNVSATDNVGVTMIKLYIDGVLFGTLNGSVVSFTWNVNNASSGTHRLQAFGYDAAGNVGASVIVNAIK